MSSPSTFSAQKKSESLPSHNLLQEVKCKHCLQPCMNEQVSDTVGTFCCSGCQAVYHLINSHGLCDYYNMEEVASRPSLKLNTAGNDFQWLDHIEVVQELGIITQGGISNIEFHCPSIHCASCLYLLDNLHKFNKGIIKSQARFNDRKVSVWFSSELIKVSELAQILFQLGYSPVFESAEDASNNINKVNRKASNRLLTRLGIAGFAAGNTMMLSFPAYFGIDSEVFYRYEWIFPVLNILLAGTAVVYSAGDWFVRSVRDLRNGKLSVDVPIAMAIGVLFLRSIADIILQASPGFFDSLCGLIFLLLIGQWLQTRYYEGLEFEHSFSSFFPLMATIIDNGGDKQVLIKNLKPGHRIRLKAHELVPADSMVVFAEHSLADQSFISGESRPVILKPGDKVFSGTRLLTGKLELEVLKAANQSWLNRLWNQASEAGTAKTEPTLFEKLFVRYFTAITFVVAFSALGYWFNEGDNTTAFNAFTAVLMVACPCAVTLAMPFSFNRALNHLAKSGFYARNAAVIEKLAHINHWVFDKTGTITQPYSENFKANIWQPAPQSQFMEPDKLFPIIKKAAELGAHPLLWELVRVIPQDLPTGQDAMQVSEFEEIRGKGIKIKIHGKGTYHIGSPSFAFANNTSEPLGSRVAISLNGEYLGSFILGHTLRPGAKNVLQTLKGEKTILTGDNESGTKLFQNPDMQALELDILFNQSPEAKRDFINNLNSKGQSVMMIGDGLNDSPAMKSAGVSLALIDRENGFSPAADCITKAPNLRYLPEWVKFSQETLSMVKIALGLSVVYNLIGVGLAASGELSPLFAAIFMPLSSLSVVALGVVLTDMKASKLPKTPK